MTHAHQFHSLDGLPDLEVVPPPKPIGRPETWYPHHCSRCMWNWHSTDPVSKCRWCGAIHERKER